MTVSSIDPKTALIVVDLQKGVMAIPATPNSMEQVVWQSSRLATEFRRRCLPVVLVNVSGPAPGRTEHSRSAPSRTRSSDWMDLVPELNRQPEDHIVTKNAWGAFVNTGLDQYLKQRGVTQVVVTGVATSIGAETTAREAYSYGFNVTIASDAMTDLSLEAHRNSMNWAFPRLGEIATTDEIIALLK